MRHNVQPAKAAFQFDCTSSRTKHVYSECPARAHPQRGSRKSLNSCSSTAGAFLQRVMLHETPFKPLRCSAIVQLTAYALICHLGCFACDNSGMNSAKFCKAKFCPCVTADLMSPAAENVQQARRLIADLEIPAEPCRADAHPNRAPESPLNNDQQAAVNRSCASQSMPDSYPPKLLLYLILCPPFQKLLASMLSQSLLQYAAAGGTVCWKSQRLLARPCMLLLKLLSLTQLCSSKFSVFLPPIPLLSPLFLILLLCLLLF